MIYSQIVLLWIFSYCLRGDFAIIRPWERFLSLCVHLVWIDDPVVGPGAFLLLSGKKEKSEKGVNNWKFCEASRVELFPKFSRDLFLPFLSWNPTQVFPVERHFLMNLCHCLCKERGISSLLHVLGLHLSSRKHVNPSPGCCSQSHL